MYQQPPVLCLPSSADANYEDLTETVYQQKQLVDKKVKEMQQTLQILDNARSAKYNAQAAYKSKHVELNNANILLQQMQEKVHRLQEELSHAQITLQERTKELERAEAYSPALHTLATLGHARQYLSNMLKVV